MGANSHSFPSRVVSIGGGLFVVLVIVWYFWSAAPPQMGDNERAFSAVDALFTAVTAKNDKLLSECESRLKKLRDDGALAEDAFAHLDGIISQAKAGDWQDSARQLYKFMRAQRREAL